jgi:hypothetical protein
MANAKALTEQLQAWNGDLQRLTRRLDREGVRWLSFSKVKAVEDCEERFRLEYVEGVRLDPRPEYFLKGELFHRAVARLYRERTRGRRAKLETDLRQIDRHWDDDPPHLKNAVRLAHAQAWDESDVVGVEEPFVIDLGDGLPPLVGIVDLVLRDGECFKCPYRPQCKRARSGWY